jgi:hypothetical protein
VYGIREYLVESKKGGRKRVLFVGKRGDFYQDTGQSMAFGLYSYHSL